MNDIMIDIETLSTQPDAAILSIGACLFNLQSGEIGHTFHRHIALDDHPKRGHISAETVKWWLKQPDAARAAITQNENAFVLESALVGLREFIPRDKRVKLWSNGASFDLVIIRSAMTRYGFIVPWQYWQERDTRTLVDIAERLTGINTAKAIKFEDTKHDALSDALHQARYISAAFSLLKHGIA